MYIYTDIKKLKKNQNLSKYLTLASFVVLIAGAIAAFSPNYIMWSFLALIVGFFLSQISISITSKWGRQPSNDTVFNVKLKGLSNNYSLYHYMEPVDHLLVGTAGAFILMPYYQGGNISFDEKKGRWTQKKANFFMKLFGQESIGRPDVEGDTAINLVRDYFISRNIDFPEEQIHPLIIFVSPAAHIDKDAHFKYDTIMLSDLKKCIRNYANQTRMDADFIDEITDKLPMDDIE